MFLVGTHLRESSRGPVGTSHTMTQGGSSPTPPCNKGCPYIYQSEKLYFVRYIRNFPVINQVVLIFKTQGQRKDVLDK